MIKNVNSRRSFIRLKKQQEEEMTARNKAAYGECIFGSLGIIYTQFFCCYFLFYLLCFCFCYLVKTFPLAVTSSLAACMSS